MASTSCECLMLSQIQKINLSTPNSSSLLLSSRAYAGLGRTSRHYAPKFEDVRASPF